MYNRISLNEELTRDEDSRSLPYQDSMEIWSVAIGRNLEANGLPVDILVNVIKRAGGLTDHEISVLLAADVREAEATVQSLFHGWMDISDARQRVLLNMAFNLGANTFAKFVKFWAAVHRGDWMEAGRQMEDSVWRVQVGVRYERLRKMIEDG